MENNRGQVSEYKLKPNEETGMCSDWVNEFASIYSGLSDLVGLPVVLEHLKKGRRLKTYEERFKGVTIEGGVITSKNEERIMKLDVLVRQANKILDTWVQDNDLKEEDKKTLVSLFEQMDRLIRGSHSRFSLK